MRFLSEGSYTESIIAFTPAIEIDPKQAEAYIGRGDAHSGVARLAAEDAAELSGEAIDSYESDVDDCLAAIGLDAHMTEAYLKAAEAYIALGDTDAAMDILSKGYEATGDESLRKRIEMLSDVEMKMESVTVYGTIIDNVQEYRNAWESYLNLEDFTVR